MRTKLLDRSDGRRTFAVVFDKGDEAKAGLESFAREHDISGASLTAIGAFQEAVLAYFDREATRYLDIPVDGPGRGALAGRRHRPQRRRARGPCPRRRRPARRHDRGGHLRSGVVWPTLEVIVEETPAHLHKRVDEAPGLVLIDLSQ